MKHKLSLYTLLFCCLSLIIFYHFVAPKYTYHAVLTYDIGGYYLYLPSFFYYSFTDFSWFSPLTQPYSLWDMPQLNPTPTGIPSLKYSMGMAIMELPWFGLAHFTAKIGGYPVDGFSTPYQFWIAIGMMIYTLSGLWIIRAVLLKYFDDKIVTICLIALSLGTHFLIYATFDSPMTHGPLFTLYACILYATHKWYEKPTLGWSIVIGLMGGLCIITRPTDVFVMAIPLAWGLGKIQDIQHRIQYWRAHLPYLIVTVVCFIIGILPQIIYWKSVTGNWIVYSYGEEGFFFDGRFLLDTFFSYQKGWLVYTPMMIFALLGFYALKKNHASLFPTILIFFLVNTYVLFSWHCWWYGGGFGQRALIQSYALLIFPFAAFWEHLLRQKAFLKSIAFTFAGLFLCLNLFQSYQSQRGPWEPAYMSRAYYWKIFGKTKDDWKHDRKFLDVTDEASPEIEKKYTLVYTNDFENEGDSLSFAAHSGKKAVILHPNKLWEHYLDLSTFHPKPEGWFRIVCTFRCKGKESIWDSPSLGISMMNGEELVKGRLLKIYHIMDCYDQWETFYFDVKAWNNKPFNKVKVYMFTPPVAKLTTYADDIQVFYTDDE